MTALAKMALWFFAAACIWGALIALTGCSAAGWGQAARVLLSAADIACAIRNAGLPDDEAARVCRITEPLREEFAKQLAGSRAGLANMQRAGMCHGVVSDAGAD